MSFNENGQNENQNWKIQNQTTTRNTQKKQHTNIQSATIYSDDYRPNVFNAPSENVGNNPLKSTEPGDAHGRSGVTSMRTDFSGLFTGKKILKLLSQFAVWCKFLERGLI